MPAESGPREGPAVPLGQVHRLWLGLAGQRRRASDHLVELIATGAVVAARVQSAARPAKPVPAPSGRSSLDVLRQLRER